MDDQNNRKALLPVFVVAGVGVVAGAAYLIFSAPQNNQASQYGVGADGFHAGTESGTDLGIAKVVDKATVVSALGDKAAANSVGDAQLSSVFNYNGDRGQTATYTFKRTDGIQASVYVDTMQFKNQADYDAASLTLNTLDAGIIKDRNSYYMLAQTKGNSQEYRLLVLDGLKAYKFVMVQPANNIQINEIASLAVLKQIAEKARF